MDTIDRDPAELRLHPLRRTIPTPDKQSPEWVALLESAAAGGILYPVIITEDGLIMDGAWRWEAAKALRLETVPCVIRPEEEAGAIVVETLIHRRQMTRGAAVYLILPSLEDFIRSSNARRLANLRRGAKNREIPLQVRPKQSALCFGEPDDLKELCRRLAISPQTFQRAVAVRNIFEEDPALKAKLEPQLLNGEKNLWNILSYEGGANAKQSGRELGLLKSGLENLRRGAAAWSQLSPAKRNELLAGWRKASAEFPAPMREALVEVLAEGVAA